MTKIKKSIIIEVSINILKIYGLYFWRYITMAVNKINNDSKNYFSNIKKSGIYQYQQSSILTAPERDTFLSQLNTPGTLAQATTRGIATYIQNNKIFNSSSDNIKSSADIYLKSGLKLLNESTLFSGNSNIFSSNSPLSGISTLMSRAISQYQANNFSILGNTGFFTGGIDTYLKNWL